MMTLAELKKHYFDLSKSHSLNDWSAAKGLSDLIEMYNNERDVLESEPVMISILAEKYLQTLRTMYQRIKKEYLKPRIRAVSECIISYATTDEINKYFVNFHSDDTSFENYLKFARGMGYMDRTKYHDLVSAYNLLML